MFPPPIPHREVGRDPVGLPRHQIEWLRQRMEQVDGDALSTYGFFHGYSNLTWTVIALQASTGLIVAITIKYTDNIVKAFYMLSSLQLIFLLQFCFYHTSNL